MRFERWVEEFRPIKNPFRPEAEVDGFVFFATGGEAQFVWRQPPENVWTFVVCDEPRSAMWLITSGVHSGNRTGYLVTARPRPKEQALDVKY